ncbi:MAG: CpsD/CapB family tyrosine-protein kinase [Pirellulales bacterium]
MTGDHLRELANTMLQSLPWSSEAGSGVKVVGVTSCYRGEGVSTIARLMATTAASSGTCEVLLIDANVDRPSVHEVAGPLGSPDRSKSAPSGNGGQFKLRPTQIPNLHALVSGRGEAGTVYEFLDLLRTLLANCRDRFDLVVVDIPALTESPSAGPLCSLLDGVVLVVEDGRVRREVAWQTGGNLERSGGKILGVVLNKANGWKNA